jgi:hypothetical protein
VDCWLQQGIVFFFIVHTGYVCFHIYYQNQLVHNPNHNAPSFTEPRHVSVWIHSIIRGTNITLKILKITLAWLFVKVPGSCYSKCFKCSICSPEDGVNSHRNMSGVLWSSVHCDLDCVRVGSDNICEGMVGFPQRRPLTRSSADSTVSRSTFREECVNTFYCASWVVTAVSWHVVTNDMESYAASICKLHGHIVFLINRAVMSESEGILGGVGVDKSVPTPTPISI